MGEIDLRNVEVQDLRIYNCDGGQIQGICVSNGAYIKSRAGCSRITVARTCAPDAIKIDRYSKHVVSVKGPQQ